MRKYYLAIDLGASNGRHIIGYQEKGEIILDEVHRFSGYLKHTNEGLVWDIDYIYKEVVEGIKKALEKYEKIESLAIDSWGVDYVLLNGENEVLPCFSYRNDRTIEVVSKVHEKIQFERLYEITGTQYQPFNSIYQLYADKLANRIAANTEYLHIPEYLNYKLTGVKKKEFTNATTTGFLNIATKEIDKEIIRKLGFNESFCNQLYLPGEVVGNLKENIADIVGGQIKVILCASHDTASAVESIEMLDNSLYLSSGTWSLLGVKIDKPITSIKSLKSNFSNEGGPNYIRYQKNIMGLWILQNLEKELKIDVKSMIITAKTSKNAIIFDVNDKAFLSPKSMKETILKFMNNKKVFNYSVADVINSSLHSLAYSYATTIKKIEDITNKKYDRLYIVGGGANNQYLNELTKEYTKKEIIALPIEATALGNIKIQMEVSNEKGNN